YRWGAPARPARPPPGRPTPCSRRSPRPSATWRHACLFSVVGLSLEVRARFHFPSAGRDLMLTRGNSIVRSRPHVDTGKPSRKRPCLIFPITPTISSPRAGSCTRIGNDPEAEQGPDELPGDPLGVVHPLEHRRVLRLVPLAHAAEGRQEDPHPRPDPLHGVAMRLRFGRTLTFPLPGRHA